VTTLLLRFLQVLVSIEKTDQKLKSVIDHISKHLNSAARRIFNSLPGVWKCNQTRPFVFVVKYFMLSDISVVVRSIGEARFAGNSENK